MARDEDLRVGLIRPITLWPFPYEAIRDRALKKVKYLVVEDNLGQMFDDIRLAVEGQAEVYFLGVLSRHLPTDLGIIFPDRVASEIKKIMGENRKNEN